MSLTVLTPNQYLTKVVDDRLKVKFHKKHGERHKFTYFLIETEIHLKESDYYNSEKQNLLVDIIIEKINEHEFNTIYKNWEYFGCSCTQDFTERYMHCIIYVYLDKIDATMYILIE